MQLEQGGLGLYLSMLAMGWAVAAAGEVVRYVIAASVASFVVRAIPGIRSKRLQPQEPALAQRQAELGASVAACGVLGIAGVSVGAMAWAGWVDFAAPAGRSWWQPCAVLVAAILTHDAYFYWTHRAMHLRSLFSVMHERHHRSTTPTPWAALSFHPLETVVNGAIYPILALALPIGIVELSAFALFATVHSALIHSGHDVYGVLGPRGLRPHARVVATSLDHDLHHSGARGNYALYLSLWDWLMGTRVMPESIGSEARMGPGGQMALDIHGGPVT